MTLNPGSRSLTYEKVGLGQPGRSETHVIIPNAPETSHTHAHTHVCARATCTGPLGFDTSLGPLTHVVLLLHFPNNLGVGRPPENPLSGESWETVGPGESQSSGATCGLPRPFCVLGSRSGSVWVLVHVGPCPALPSSFPRGEGPPALTVGL